MAKPSHNYHPSCGCYECCLHEDQSERKEQSEREEADAQAQADEDAFWANHSPAGGEI